LVVSIWPRWRKAPLPRLPVLATIPRSGTWFLRYAVAFFCHLQAGGRVRDRVTGATIGTPSGKPFDFEGFVGGPLFAVRPALPSEHLFVGHAVCPGFGRIAGEVPWWSDTPFHVPGYDYLHEGFDYDWTPIDLAPQRYVPISPTEIDLAPWVDAGQRIALVYRDPLDQIDSFRHYSSTHAQECYRTFRGRSLRDVPLREFALGGGLASYARQFISYQMMAEHLPGQVRLVRYEHLMAEPLDVLAGLLEFLGNGARIERQSLASAVELARPQHLRAIEHELGRSLDGSHSARHGHMRSPAERAAAGGIDPTLRRTAMQWLWGRGLDPKYFPPRDMPSVADRILAG
jgi:hypothetical protein